VKARFTLRADDRGTSATGQGHGGRQPDRSGAFTVEAAGLCRRRLREAANNEPSADWVSTSARDDLSPKQPDQIRRR
jgi:hypothetical protein